MYIVLGALCLVTCVLWSLVSDTSLSLVLMPAVCPFVLMVIGAVSLVQASRSRKADMEGSEEARVRIRSVPGSGPKSQTYYFEKIDE